MENISNFLMGDKLLVADFEFSCWRGRPPKGMRVEIIEMGFCLVDFSKEVVEPEKSYLIKPSEFSEISPFFSEMTGITKEEVDDSGVSFVQAMEDVSKEFDLKNTPWSTWGVIDKRRLEIDCALNALSYPMNPCYINVQKAHKNWMKVKTDFSLKNALETVGLSFVGNAHRAGSDAYNTGRVVLNMLKRS
jgi:inhibitor of KinA sporulation pathway (predicted exonuclease)